MRFFIGLVFHLAATVWAGDVSGGGGDSLPGEKITPQDVRKSVGYRSDAGELKLYFNTRAKRPIADEVDRKLFGGKTDIFDILNKVRVRVDMNEPCVAPDGSPHDGYAPDSKWGGLSICLSGKRLAEKLSSLTLRPALLGLVAHEISHLVGTNEEEAESLQKDVVQAFLRVSREFTLDKLMNFEQSSIMGERARYIAEDLVLNATTTPPEKNCEKLNELNIAFSGVQGDMILSSTYPFRYFSPKQYRQIVVLSRLKISNAMASYCAIHHPAANMREYYEKSWLKGLYDAGDEVSLVRALEHLPIGEGKTEVPNPHQFSFRNARDGAILKTELSNLLLLAEDSSEVFYYLIRAGFRVQ